MEWIETPESTSIAGFGYDGEPRVLIVAFKSGEWYAYFDVDRDVFVEWRKADSKGRFFVASVRNNYRYSHIKPKLPEQSAG